MFHSYKNVYGFSLIELLATIAIVGIIAAISAHGFSAWMNNAQTRSASDNFRASLTFARSESITHGGNVRLCGSQNGTTCAATLDDGWIIYHDTDNNSAWSVTDTVLLWREQEYQSLSVSAVDNAGTATADIGFNYRGYPATEVTVSISRNTVNNNFAIHQTGRIEKL